MGVEKFNKVYILSHTHKFKKKSECTLGHQDSKLLGVFYSKQKAKEELQLYKTLKGFIDEPNGFLIEEYCINKINGRKLDELLKKKNTLMSNEKTI